jgi:hypothetical protein
MCLRSGFWGPIPEARHSCLSQAAVWSISRVRAMKLWPSYRLMGVVPNTNGDLIISEPIAFFEGSGMWYESLASTAPRPNIVTGGALDINFRGRDSYEALCIYSFD